MMHPFGFIVPHMDLIDDLVPIRCLLGNPALLIDVFTLHTITAA